MLIKAAAKAAGKNNFNIIFANNIASRAQRPDFAYSGVYEDNIAGAAMSLCDTA